jgi:lipoprotein-releasing system permease protein
MKYQLITFIARRLTQSFKKERFIRFTKGVALVSVMLGSMALIIALSVLEGFDNSLRENAAKFTSHIQFKTVRRQPFNADQPKFKNLTNAIPMVKAASPSIEREGLVRAFKTVEGVYIRGIDPLNEITGLKNNVVEGKFEFPSDTALHVIVGKKLARKLGITLGDSVLLTTLSEEANLEDSSEIPAPVFEYFTVSGIYETGMAQYDDVYMYVPFKTASRIFQFPENSATSYDVVLKNVNDAPEALRQIEDYVGYPFYGLTIFEIHGSMFAWIELQKQPIPIVLGLISIVAVFNVLTTLLISVVEKTHTIGILRSLGMPSGGILKIFVIQGISIGLVGTLAGCALGFMLCWLQDTFHIIRLQGEIYYLDTLPVAFKSIHYIIVITTSLLLSFLATLIPAWIAIRISPTRALVFK